MRGFRSLRFAWCVTVCYRARNTLHGSNAHIYFCTVIEMRERRDALSIHSLVPRLPTRTLRQGDKVLRSIRTHVQ